MPYLLTDKTIFRPELKKTSEANRQKTNGTWTEVFGSGLADELFMAWNYARYMNLVTKAGKVGYPVPVSTNMWIV